MRDVSVHSKPEQALQEEPMQPIFSIKEHSRSRQNVVQGYTIGKV